MSTQRRSRATQLMVEPFDFLDFTQWDCTQAFNEHGVLRITGLIAERNRTRYANMARREVQVCAKALNERGSEVILFQGVLTNLSVASQHELHTMTIEIKTGTFLLDQRPHTRTFHPSTTTYRSMIKTCLDAANGGFAMRERRDQQARQFTVQYQESDWSFIQRLARRLGVVTFPDVRTAGKRVVLGLTPNANAIDIDFPVYRMTQSTSDPHSLIRYERGVYHIETRDIYTLGQAVNFQEKRLVISEINSRLEGSELVHRYALCVLRSSYSAQEPHTAIKGVAMRARVTRVSRDRVQVLIHEDENRRNSGVRWFDYATVYSTPDGTGLFAMPEVGDEVRVLFPNGNESGAYVASSVHLETQGGRTNPNHKSWKNRQNKEILFTPDALILTNNRGLSIELSDKRGITINSNRGIFLQSDGQIQMNSQAGVTAYGERSVALQQGSAQVHMQDTVDIAGGKIKMN